MKNNLRVLALVFLLLAFPVSSWAIGVQFTVENAELVEPGKCELEAWYLRSQGGGGELAVMPICNPTGRFDIGVGVTRAPGDEYYVDLEAKTVIRPLAEGQSGWRVSLASMHSDGVSTWEGAAVNLPVSTPLTDALLLHTNVGWEYSRGGQDMATWGVAAEYDINDNWGLVAETSGNHRGDALWQSGLQYSLPKGNIVLSYGSELDNSNESWWALGFIRLF